MNKSLSTFMMIAAVAVILAVLVNGVFNSMNSKNNEHQDLIKNEYNLKIKA